MMGPIKHLEANESSRVHQTSAETMWIVSLGPRMFWGTRATNFSIYTAKMEGAGPKILNTGANCKFKQVPCQKKCRVNRAFVYISRCVTHSVQRVLVKISFHTSVLS